MSLRFEGFTPYLTGAGPGRFRVAAFAPQVNHHAPLHVKRVW
jgi:hypothetical protein